MPQLYPTCTTGSILVVVMKVVSLGFDLEAAHREEHKKPLVPVPDFLHYASYCLFPATTVFGPFMTYHQHLKFLTPTPLVRWYEYLVVLCVNYSVECLEFNLKIKFIGHIIEMTRGHCRK